MYCFFSRGLATVARRSSLVIPSGNRSLFRVDRYSECISILSLALIATDCSSRSTSLFDLAFDDSFAGHFNDYSSWQRMTIAITTVLTACNEDAQSSERMRSDGCTRVCVSHPLDTALSTYMEN